MMMIYRILSILLFPFLELYIFFRLYKKKEDKKRLKERFGHSTILRPKNQIVWLHAVSVGETNSAFILIEELLSFFPQISILFQAFFPEIARERYLNGARILKSGLHPPASAFRWSRSST